MSPPGTPAATIPPDERRAGESGQAFAAFKVFLGMAPESRSCPAVAAHVHKSPSLIRRWAARHDWVERGRLADNARAALERDARDQKRARNAALWERRRAESLDRIFQLSERLREKAVEMLEVGLSSTNWTMASATTAAKVAADLGMFSISEALTEEDGFDPEAATPEEARAYIDRHVRQRKAIRDAARRLPAE
jgi:hypothetical protein